MTVPAKTEDKVLALNEETKLFITFWLGGFLFAIPVEEVVEINRSLDITPVPLSTKFVAGIINLRGQIITAIDLATHIGLEKHSQAHHNVIIGRDAEPISLLVEQIGDVLEIPVSEIEEPPDVIEGLDTKFVKNVCQLPENLLVILDAKLLLNN